MNKTLIIALLVLFSCAACTKKAAEPIVKALDAEGIEAIGPYLTQDEKGIPVLCWTEQDAKDSLYRLKYARYDQQKDAFGQAITVPASAGMSTSAESMGKIAFKSDGAIIAVFAKRFAAEKNPYAGAIYYSHSTDNGKSWSEAMFLHSDTAHAYGRSFFDIARLKNGELAAIWLDGRFGKAIKGSALFYSQTLKGAGFGPDTCLDKGTCECCRTAILTDEAGRIHLAYRSINIPDPLAGKQIRDMVYKSSSDNGQTFTEAKPISKDNWEINGCPHSGPTLAMVKNTLHAVWFTAGGSPGLYHTQADFGGDFAKRNLVSAEARHPQMAALQNGKIAMVAEQAGLAESEHQMHMDHSKGGMMRAMAATPAKIILQLTGEQTKNIDLSDGKSADNHAVVTATDNQLFVAWVRAGKNGSSICYTKVNAEQM